MRTVNPSGVTLNMRRGFFLAILLLSITGVSSGQTTTQLKLVITDDAGAAIPGAAVTIKKSRRNWSRTGITNRDGEAVFDRIEPGTYDVEVVKSNFDVFIQMGLAVEPGAAQTITVRLTLTAGALQMTAAERSQIDLGEQISPLPNLNNDLTPLLQVVPGSIATGSASLGRVVIDGKGNEQQTVRLDGVDFSVLADLPGVDAAVDSLGSFQKPEVAGDLDNSTPQTRAFAPMFGPGTGSALEAVTYRGVRVADSGSVWQAQLYADLRNDKFNARNFFDFDGKNGLRRSRFGAKAGGPLDGKERYFIFGAYDGIRARIERNVYEAVPSDAAMASAVGFAARLLLEYRPAGTGTVTGATSQNPDFTIVRRRALTSANSNAGDVRFDYYPHSGATTNGAPAPNSGDVLTSRITLQRAENFVADGVTGRRQRQTVTFLNGVVSWHRVKTNRPAPNNGLDEFGHNFRFGFNLVMGQIAVEKGSATESDLSQSLISLGSSVGVVGLPGTVTTVPIATLGGLLKGAGRGSTVRPNSYTLGYDYSRLINSRHKLNVGLEARLIRLKFDRLGGLTYNFPDVNAFKAGTPTSVTYLSDLSGPSPFTSGFGPRHAQQEYYMGYAQMASEFRNAADPGNPATEPALKLTYGFRYDYFSPVRERDNRAVIVNPINGNLLATGSRFYRAPGFNLEPRFGLAYRLSESSFFRNTVLRAGFGLYSGVGKTGDYIMPIESDRFNTGISGGTFPISPADVTRSFAGTPATRQFQPLAFGRDFVGLEHAYKWEAQLTKTLDGFDLSALYSGNVGRNLPVAHLGNKIVSVTTNPDPTQPAMIVRELDIVHGTQILKPFGEFYFRGSDGRSSYNALTIQFKRNRKADVSPNAWLKTAVMNLNVQYTLSRNVGNVSGTAPSNPFILNDDFGYNAADAKHNFKVSAVYDFWTALRRKSTNPIWGWKIMPSLKVSSGLPVVVRIIRPDVIYLDTVGNVFATPAVGRRAVINTPGGGETGSARVPDLIPGVPLYLKDNLNYLNPAAFATPPPGTFGNLRRGQVRGPGIVQLDLGIRRNIFYSEQTKISGEFQIDVYNLLNRANFSNPTVALPNVLGIDEAGNQLQPGRSFNKINAGSFGVLSAADNGRIIQFSFTLRLNQGFTK
jgi:hypothetical protein